ncbi:MAG TPA: tail fiber domain-containing protein, partial [Chitinophagales bacterium]|nr:tail fiber domain-containing protein [Chitinophagales bacterium]
MAIGTGIYNGNSNTVAIGNSSVTSINLSGATSTSNALTVGTNSTNGNGAYLTKGGTWTNASDRNLKDNIMALDPASILKKVAQLPISKWKYTGTEEYHIGPMAQDFYALFNVGEDDRRISSIDPSGVALSAIQALNQKVEEQQKIIEQLLIELKAIKAK